jgi:hypothetical protein
MFAGKKGGRGTAITAAATMYDEKYRQNYTNTTLRAQAAAPLFCNN